MVFINPQTSESFDRQAAYDTYGNINENKAVWSAFINEAFLLDSAPKQYEKDFKNYNSTKKTEVFSGRVPVGLMQKTAELSEWPLDSQLMKLIATVSADTYRLAEFITKQAMQDDQQKVLSFSNISSEFVDSDRQTRELQHADFWNTAFVTTSHTLEDGLAFFSTVHTREDGGTYKNTLSTPMDLSITALQQIGIDIAKTPTGRGIPIGKKPLELKLPHELKYYADELLNSILKAETGNNNKNSLDKMEITPDVLLTDTDAYFVRWMEKSNKMYPLLTINRQGLETNLYVLGYIGGAPTLVTADSRFKPFAYGGRGWFGSPGV